MVLHASSSKPVGCLTVVLEGKPVEEFDAWGAQVFQMCSQAGQVIEPWNVARWAERAE
jgi:hypothetical protein